MPSNFEIISQTQTARAIAEELEIAICRSECIIASQSLQLAIDSIPFQIAAAEADQLSTVTLFALVEGEHFTVPEQVDPYKSERPEEEWLTGDAATVFRYCVDAGLLPSLAPYTQPLDSLLQSELVIDWAGTTLANSGTTRGQSANFRASSLVTSRVRVPYPEQEAIRKRVSRVLAVAPTILHNARLAAAAHHHKTVLLCLPSSRSHEEAFEQERDFALFCELLGIPAVCRTKSKPGAAGAKRQFTVTYQLR